jgi:hypothetical protein
MYIGLAANYTCVQSRNAAKKMELEAYNSHDNYVHVIEGDQICTEYG